MAASGCQRQRAAPEQGKLSGVLSLSDFVIEKELARTAAGSVYRAKHGRSGRTVVLKARRSAEIGRDGSMEHEVRLNRRMLLSICIWWICRLFDCQPVAFAESTSGCCFAGSPAAVAEPPKHHPVLWFILEPSRGYVPHGARVC